MPHTVGFLLLLALMLALKTFDASAQAYVVPSYKGYRLQLTAFEILKQDDEQFKIRLDVANTGRYDIDLSHTNTIHWIQILFDSSIFQTPLHPIRDNIRQALIDKKLKLSAGKVLRNVTLKVPRSRKPFIEPALPLAQDVPPPPPPVASDELSEKGGLEPPPSDADLTNPPLETEPCPDVAFTSLSIVSESDKEANLIYTITNLGLGDFHLCDDSDKLIIRAYISGVTKLTRGAIPIGAVILEKKEGVPPLLKKGETFRGSVKFDVSKKTRYMKCLILQLDSEQFIRECDRTNNTAAVVLR
ncbi:MAG: hypothetical protein KatS3mg030_221 [Saprospiraceae bacterium]|nr:MAG: hypothetical protein KatS3mg030_221 [Saprospiraceae bacterium]